MKSLRSAIAMLALISTAGRCGASADDSRALRRSVVKIYVTVQKPDYYQPWQETAEESISGSGVIIAGRRILTNAHVVSDSTYIEVRLAGEAKRYVARVESVAHDCELATLKVDAPEFFRGTAALALDSVPHQRDKVTVYGFPLGGDELSITEGIISRIEVVDYAHSALRLLALQTDAAINPGNSGGPMVKDGRLVGVAFQSISGGGAENIGYAVPVPIIRRFLRDIKDGAYGGIPDMGIVTQPLENESLRRLCGMRPGQQGVLIDQIQWDSSAWGALLEGDILTSLDGVPIANDGTFLFERDMRLSFSHLVTMHLVGETVQVEIRRHGKPMNLAIRMKAREELVPGPLYDIKPTYFIYAGLVFTVVTRNYIGVWNTNDIPVSLLNLQDYGQPASVRRQAVVLSYVLPHDINRGYQDLRGVLIDSVNGRKVSAMRDLVEALHHPTDGFQVIRTDPLTDSQQMIVLDGTRAEAANKEILHRRGIKSDRSEDLGEYLSSTAEGNRDG